MAQSPLCKSITQAVLASLTAEAPVMTQSNLPKPRQTRRRAAASTQEHAATADASLISTTGVAVHDIVKAVMAKMEPLVRRSGQSLQMRPTSLQPALLSTTS